MTDDTDPTDWTDPETFRAALDRADTREKGTYFEAFAEGDRIEHDPGIRLSRAGNERWMAQTLNHDPTFWRSDAAAERGYDEPPIHPDYLLAATMGPSVEDLSEKGGYFLGRTGVRYRTDAVYPGTELRVDSTVIETRASGSRPDYGIVTWETTGRDADTGDALLSYRRTNMIPRREPIETDGGQTTGDRVDAGTEPEPELPDTLLTPDGQHFEDFSDALDDADGRDAAVAYRHERGRTIDDALLAGLPLATLNTAKQHHDAATMADSPSGEPVVYGDVTRSIALGHARSDERTYRELGYDDERFHDFVTAGDTVYGFTRVLDASETPTIDVPSGVDATDAGAVRFEHVAFNQNETPVYSGTRTALIETRN
ncbi:L-erythro-3-methylmalyl-CoA dehydratase [Natronoarchaeum philippinense]|uniref:L-erythro-3-methylmalyl-CoA dehydratase n=1 Tax=Natronoarchaeum philippinense TaxID=558529 RepID=A0A285N3Z2_NATPI|nr:2-methylfumaryl-CoA hydratase [Natronoarchaeum philippinense]SNZ04194.1 L-erythro-3-methylmalyl-CoA dehydratase [Natronoarchaeum philippinense]